MKRNNLLHSSYCMHEKLSSQNKIEKLLYFVTSQQHRRDWLYRSMGLTQNVQGFILHFVSEHNSI